MRYFLKDFAKMRAILNTRRLLLFLDYDGTIAPIADTPEKARVPVDTEAALRGLVKNPRCRVAVISGRSLKDIKRRLDVRGLVYVGNHGLEIDGPKLKYRADMLDEYLDRLRKLRNSLCRLLNGIKGVIIEDKGLTLALHYRKVKASQVPWVQALFHEVTIYDAIKGAIKIKTGKKVVEIRPPGKWNKGRAVLWLINRWKVFLKGGDPLVVYVGDDLTDEDAFSALSSKDSVTVLVGRPRCSMAKYYLRNCADVAKMLNMMLTVLTKRGVTHGRSKKS